ncbi:MAG TPA: hypothetical protein PKH07_11695, partial [bacterium]|nr:hypothetical protein [bacterium]
PLPRGVTHTGRLRMLQAGMGDGLLRVLIESQTKTRRRKVLQDVIIEKVLLKEGTIRYRNQSNSSSPFEMELQRVSALLDDVLLDDKAELRSATLRSLTGFWPASTEPGLQYAGSFERSGDTYQGHLVGRISAFPLVLVREPIEKELGTVIRGGLVDLDSDVKVHGTLMDSTHTLVINGLDLSMEKSLHRKIKVDLANLVVEILKMLGSEDNIVLENIRLKADLAANTENLWEDLARSALEAVLSRLAERMLHGIREGGEKARERLKQIGESLLDALE